MFSLYKQLTKRIRRPTGGLLKEKAYFSNRRDYCTTNYLRVIMKSPELNNQTWQLFKQGKKTAFATIYHAYFNDLFLYGVKVVGDREATHEILQDFFVYLWSKREALGDVKSVRHYLITSFRRHIFHTLRKQRTYADRVTDYSSYQPGISFSIENKLVEEESEREQKSMVLSLINQLTPRQREVIYLKYFNGLSTGEIAETMALNYFTVANHLVAAGKALRKYKQECVNLVGFLGFLVILC